MYFPKRALFKRNDVYAETFGNGIGMLALNYEHQLQKEPGFGFRLGIGYFSADVDNKVSIPVGMNYLIRLHQNKSFLDAGIGVTWSSDEWIKDPPGGTITKEDFEHIFSFVPSIGFRQHLIKEKFMWRINACLIMNKYRIFPFPGLAIGMRF